MSAISFLHTAFEGGLKGSASLLLIMLYVHAPMYKLCYQVIIINSIEF